jgi:SAM-dependent methyltransferase
VHTASAGLYDALYRWKDYRGEAERAHAVIQEHKRSAGNALLDVACGTGAHLTHLRRWYAAEGLEISAEMLAVARQRCPDVRFHHADMTGFDLGKQFDAVVCLFGSIGYARTPERLAAALQAMARHLLPGGLLLLEPWLGPDDYPPRGLHATFVDEPELKVARINANRIEGRLSVLEFHYLVGTSDGVHGFAERHELGLFTRDEYLAGLRAAGLEASDLPEGLIGRGLYLGLRAA